jgi:hypothetical protein
MTTKPNELEHLTSTQFILSCDAANTADLSNIRVNASDIDKLIIYATSPYACPVFELSSIWRALTDNSFIFGVVLFVVGFIMLFFGILMTHLMIFITAYFLSFAVLMGVVSAFLRPDSSTIAIYFALLFILFLATLIAYSLTRLVKVSVFFIGACKQSLMQFLASSWRPCSTPFSQPYQECIRYGLWSSSKSSLPSLSDY